MLVFVFTSDRRRKRGPWQQKHETPEHLNTTRPRKSVLFTNDFIVHCCRARGLLETRMHLHCLLMAYYHHLKSTVCRIPLKAPRSVVYVTLASRYYRPSLSNAYALGSRQLSCSSIVAAARNRDTKLELVRQPYRAGKSEPEITQTLTTGDGPAPAPSNPSKQALDLTRSRRLKELREHRRWTAPGPPQQWTAAERERLATLALARKSNTDIAEELNRSISSVRSQRFYGCPQARKSWTKAEDDIVKLRASQGCRNKVIAHELKRSEKSVAHKRHRLLGSQLSMKTKGHIWSEEEMHELIQLWKIGLPTSEICERLPFATTVSAVKAQLYGRGCLLRPIYCAGLQLRMTSCVIYTNWVSGMEKSLRKCQQIEAPMLWASDEGH